jgi:hypothetical protein
MLRKGHRGHAYCGRLCLPHFLYDEFQSCLGPKAEEFDLLVWVTKQDAQFFKDFGLIAEPLTAWREAFRAELMARGWFTPTRQKPPLTRLMPSAAPRVVEETCPHTPPCHHAMACDVKQRIEGYRRHA